MTKGEKELIEEKFKGVHLSLLAEMNVLNGRLDGQDQKLDFIKEQTIKTNSRVNSVETEVDTLKIEVNTLSPIVNSNKSTLKGLEDARFILRHPKLFIGGIVILVLLTLATLATNKPFKVFTKNGAQIEQPITVNSSNDNQ